MSQYKVAVLGGGSFGTVIANLAASNGYATTLWLRDPRQLADMRETGENTRYLPGFPLSPDLQFSDDLQAAVGGADLIFVSIPSKAFRNVLQAARPALRPDHMLVSTTKGVEKDSFALMSEILCQETGLRRIGVISGPNLAKEIMAQQIAGTVVASHDEGLRDTVHAVLSCTYFRVFSNTDIYGVELGGALKNIYAVASGIAAAHKIGENTRAMLMTRSLAEMSRFAVHLGANPLTFLGLAGVGDLIATCSSSLSRNFQVGLAIGQGQTLEEIVEELEQTAEGINTIHMVKHKADELGIRMPLVSGLYEVVFKGRSLYDVVLAMMLASQSSDVEFLLPKPGEG